MTVFVDDMAAPFEPSHRPGRKYVMCHMIADSDEELHAMADKIGVYRRWHQNTMSGSHYDITKSKRALAVAAGAVEITLRQCAAMCSVRRQTGRLPKPDEAIAKMMELRERPLAPQRREHEQPAA
jgi:hypothetical protein